MGLKITKILSKNWVPIKQWEEILRQSDEVRFKVKIGHIDPRRLADPDFINPRVFSESETKQTVIIGSEHPHGPKIWERAQQEASKMLEECAQALGQADLIQKAQELKEKSSEAIKSMSQDKLFAPVSEKFDYHSFIIITELADEKIAKQTLESRYLVPTKGFLDAPVPGMNIPGMSDKTTLRELFKSGVMKDYITKEQIKEVEKAMGEVKNEFPKNVKMRKGKYQGFDVTFLEGKNQSSIVPSIKESKDRDKVFDMVRAGRFIVSGTLLRVVNTFPLASTPCDSLTKFKTKTTTYKIGDQTFVDKEIRPVKSTLAKEGYLHKEEVDKIFKSIFSTTKG